MLKYEKKLVSAVFRNSFDFCCLSKWQVFLNIFSIFWIFLPNFLNFLKFLIKPSVFSEILEFSQEKLSHSSKNLENIADFLQDFNKSYFFLINFGSFADLIKRVFAFLFAFLENSSQNPHNFKPRTESRYNFASLLGGAKILEKSPDCFYEKSVLDDNPDKY